MQPLLYHLYSGQMFFSAALILCAAAALSLSGVLERSPMLRSVVSVLSLSSIFAAALSGVPMPLAQAAIVVAVTSGFALFGIAAPGRRRVVLASLALIAVIASAAIELRWHVGPSRVLEKPRRVIVIGDSLSSGGFGETTTWPELLSRALGARLVNLSLAGETSTSAMRNQLPDLPPAATGDCVIVAIGGNDMLEGFPLDAFSASLDRLLAESRAGGTREVVMLELPTIPGEWGFGAIQRRLAARHGVTLVPRRVIAGVLLETGCTYDGLHPTQNGHARLAHDIARAIGW